MNTAIRSAARHGLLPLLAALALAHAAQATTPLADQPVFSSRDVPGNLALALSVEFPTAVSVAHTDATYSTTKTYLGYFDPNKCYLYAYHATETNRHFYPAGLATNRTCTGGDDAKWSGNYLNWATMQTIDPFRWALTGGYRVVDTATETIIEKAHASGQGGTGNFPNRTTTSGGVVADHTPMAWSQFRMRVQGLGNKMRFSQNGNIDNTPTPWQPGLSDANTVYEVSVRVKVCDTAASAGGLESNCTAYPAGNYKPTGLLQQYSNSFRYSAFGYLNDGNIQRDGGVLRARQKFVGPTHPVPTSTPITNVASEWDENTGVLYLNPDAADATTTNTVFGLAAGTVANSGVINYLNKFGQLVSGAQYKTYDPVGELYYAALRYFKNLGNVPEWTDVGAASVATKTTWVDGFPVITSWDDPIQYSCQKNFILGIGDVNTHADKNVPGSGIGTSNEPTRPGSLSTDPFDAKAATDKVGTLHGITNLGSAENYGGCCNNNSALMAGLAYHANTKDIRPTVTGQPQTTGMQTVQTYWLDILEYQTYKSNNQYYLAAKYGGFKVPTGFDPDTRSTDISQAWWSTSGETVGGQNRPDNYFVASDPAAMVLGLKRAFSKLLSDLQLYSTSFSTALPQVSVSGSSSYSAKYDAGAWTGEIEGNTLTFDANYNPTQVAQWSFSTKLAAQLSGTGWDTNRRMVTWNTATGAGVPFRWASISAAQQTALDTVYRTGSDGADFLNYIRGDTTYEEGSAAAVPTASKVYRARTTQVGDIVGSRVLPVAPPSGPFADGTNPGYSTFKTTYASRPTMLYVGTNAGVLHAINGALSGADAGKEVFAYVPGAMFNGPTAPGTDGLQARGDPNFTHKPMIDGPVSVFDIDLGRTPGGSGTNWRTVLVGSYGKGGKGYFAIDVTDPATMTSEATVAGRVMWEIHQSQAGYGDLGFTFGQPVAVRTRKYGWVLIFASGYNNSNGNAYFFVVNPRTGALLEKVAAPVTGSASSQLGMAHLEAYVLDFSEGIADAVYAGDLKGNVFRLDVSSPSAAYTVTHFAQVTNAAGTALPITTPPAVLLHPRLNRRYVAFGTGRLLDTSDITNTNPQVFAIFRDGNGAGFNKPHNSSNPTQPNTLPAGVSFPLQRSNLQFHNDLTVPLPVLTPPNPAAEMGWWVDLGVSTGGNGYRVIRDPSTFNGMISFISTLPTPDACNPSGVSRLYSVDAGTGRSEIVRVVTLPSGATTTVHDAYYTTGMAGEGISVQDLSVNGKRVSVFCTNSGGCEKPPTEPPTPPGLRRLNWRELQLAD